MKFNIAAPFLYKNRFNGRIDEFNIEYAPGVNDGNKLMQFLQECDDDGKKVNITFPNGVDADLVWPFVHFSNMRVRITNPSEFAKLGGLRERGVSFFLDERFRACNWKQLRDQISLGCSQIYIADDLTHCIEKVYNICEDNGVGLRCVLNHVHSTGPYCGTNDTDWFMRPEDMDTVGRMFDVFEFDCSYANKNGAYEWSKFDALYNVYIKKREYSGNLQEINWQLGFRFENSAYLSSYVNKTRCGFHCASGSSCNLCHNMRELADLFFEKGLMVETKRKEQNE